MRKTILLCGMALLTGTSAMRAQLHIDLSPQLRFGVTAGLNIPHATTSESDMKPYVERVNPGFLVGPTVFYMTPMGKTKPLPYLGADLSVHYDQRAAKPDNKDVTPIKSPIKLQTIQIPLNLRFGVNINDVAVPFVFAGPQIAFNIGKKEQLFAEGWGKSTGHDLIRKWVPKSSALSLNFGVGVIAMDRVQARIAYNLPLQKSGDFVQKDLDTGKESLLGTGKIGSCQIMISWLF